MNVLSLNTGHNSSSVLQPIHAPHCSTTQERMPKYFGASVIITTPIRATIHRLPRVLYLLPSVFRCKLKSHHFFSTETPSALAATLPPHLAWTSKKPETNIPLTTRLKAPLI